MAKQVKRSVLPICFVGATWLVSDLFFSLRSMGDYLLCAAVSAGVFVLGKAIFPDTANTTGDPKIDALIKEGERAVSEMRRLSDAIEDEKISRRIDHLEQTTGKIIDHVVAHPGKLPRISRFMSYDLPATIKMLNAYDRMDSTGVAGDNISGTKQRVEKMLDTLVQAYDRQLDALFGEEAMDISTDIAVMEHLLRQQGFPCGDRINRENGSVTLEL